MYVWDAGLQQDVWVDPEPIAITPIASGALTYIDPPPTTPIAIVPPAPQTQVYVTDGPGTGLAPAAIPSVKPAAPISANTWWIVAGVGVLVVILWLWRN